MVEYTNLDHDVQYSHVEGKDRNSIEGKDQRSKGAELLEPINTTERTKAQNGNLNGIISQNSRALLTNSVSDDLTSRNSHISDIRASVHWRRGDTGWDEIWVAKDGLGKLHGFIKAHSDDEEWQCFGECDWIDGEGECVCQWQGKDEGEAAGDEGAKGEPEIGAELAEGEEETEECDMHEYVA